MPLKQEVGGSKPSGPVFTLTKVLAMMKAHCDDCGKQCFRNVAKEPLELTRGKTTIKMEVVGCNGSQYPIVCAKCVKYVAWFGIEESE